MSVMQVHISKLEDAINRCSKETSSKNSLSEAGSALSEIYGQMIYEKKEEIDFSDYLARNVFNADHRVALEKYYEFAS